MKMANGANQQHVHDKQAEEQHDVDAVVAPPPTENPQGRQREQPADQVTDVPQLRRRLAADGQIIVQRIV